MDDGFLLLLATWVLGITSSVRFLVNIGISGQDSEKVLVNESAEPQSATVNHVHTEFILEVLYAYPGITNRA